MAHETTEISMTFHTSLKLEEIIFDISIFLPYLRHRDIFDKTKLYKLQA